MSTRWYLVLIAASVSIVDAQTPLRMKYLGEIGHLGGPDPRTSANLGIARAFPDSDGELRFEGKDLAGKRWRVWLPAAGGVGGTDVWTADFDRNGRQDLLISAMFPKNGHCTDGTVIYTLMFDRTGRPVPWMMPSNTFTGYGHPPLGLVAMSASGRAEMITVACDYSDQLATGVFEDRRISGVYEARDSRWYPVRSHSDETYLPIVNPRSHGSAQIARWLPTDPALSSDFLAGFNDQSTTQLESLTTRAVGCGGIRLPIVNGRIVSEVADDPCDSLQHEQIVFSDGISRKGWPLAVIDSPDGRDVFLSNSSAPLISVLTLGQRFKVLGSDPHAPSLLWADTRENSQVVQPSVRLRTWQPVQVEMTVQARLPTSKLTGQETIVRVGQRCFAFRSSGENAARVAELEACPAVHSLTAFRPKEGEGITAQQLQLPAGANASVLQAVRFHEGWLVEWQSGLHRFMVLHSASGKPLTTEMPVRMDEYLVDSDRTRGVYFLRFKNGQPADAIVYLAAVEWFKAPK